jgi:hypothetical protein
MLYPDPHCKQCGSATLVRGIVHKKYLFFQATKNILVPKLPKDTELSQPPDNSKNPWCQLLAAHPELERIPFILPANTKTSIIQEKDMLFQVSSAL